jgi:hypothetical protein
MCNGASKLDANGLFEAALDKLVNLSIMPFRFWRALKGWRLKGISKCRFSLRIANEKGGVFVGGKQKFP